MSATEHPAYREGLNLLRERQYHEALKAFNKALEDEPNSPDIISDRGVTYLHLGQKQKALDDMNRAVELEPDYAYRYASRAFVRDSMGDLEGAVEDYRYAVKLEPDDSIAHNNLGILEEKMGYQNSAKKHFDKADELAENDPEFQEFMKGSQDPKPDPSEPAILPPRPEGVPISPNKTSTKKEEPKAGDHIRVMLEVFRKKETFKDFVRFVRRGFKNED